MEKPIGSSKSQPLRRFFFTAKWNMEASSTSATGSSSINCLCSRELVGGLSPNSANGDSALPPDHSSNSFAAELDENPTAPSNPTPSVPEAPPKIIVRLRTNDNKKSDQDAAADTDKKESSAASDGDCNNNKRPRREIKKTSFYGDVVVGASRVETPPPPRRKTSRLPPRAGKSEERKAKKLRGVPIELTRAEIEGDILAMTRGNAESPLKRDNEKRPSKVQEELDNRFPGLLLPYINVSKYANRRSKARASGCKT